MATRVTVEADTVQTDVVCEDKLTVRFEDAVALRVKGVVPRDWLERGLKVMVWDAAVMVKLWLTGAAAE